jgi:hypothetical protein
VRHFQSTLRFLFNRREKHLLHELGAHAVQRLVVGIPQDLLGESGGWQQESRQQQP